MTEQEKGCPGCGYIGTFFGMFCDNCSASRQIKEQEPEKIKMTKPKATTGLDKWLDDSFGSSHGVYQQCGNGSQFLGRGGYCHIW